MNGGIPVFACSRGDYDDLADKTPIGYAATPGQAAKMMRDHLSETTGADYSDDLKASTIYYSRQLNAYFTEE